MMHRCRSFTALGLLVALVVSGSGMPRPLAAAACTGSVSPQALNPNHSADLSFTITNTGEAPVTWVKFTSPSSNFEIQGGSSSGWSRSFDVTTVTFTGGSLAAGGDHTFLVRVQTGTTGTETEAWSAAVSENGDGSGSAGCTGDLGVAVSNDTTAPVISSVAVSGISTSGATVTWNTDEPATSTVQYGPTSSYGTTASDSSLVTSHSMALTGLSPGTSYHYRVRSLDETGNVATSSDATFTTDAGVSLVISNVRAENITAAQATISWTTNVSASSRVRYGPTSSYGNTKSGGGQVTSHSLTLTGLSPDTAYHYQVESTDAEEATRVSSDNTFTTAVASGSGSGTGDSGSGAPLATSGSTATATPGVTPPPFGSAGSTPAPGGTAQATPRPPLRPPDRVPPTVTLTTDLSRPFAAAPRLSGSARDNRAVARIEYSLDSGQNWLPVTVFTGGGTTRASFEIELAELTDDNYSVLVRAYDASGNIGHSDPATLIIDTMPPEVGMSLYAVAAQPVAGTGTGLVVVAGLDQRVTVSARGGATAIDLIARPIGDAGEEQVFSLVKNIETGLWTGTISLATPGDYELVARARDGAGNVTERVLRRLTAVRGGLVVADEAPVAEALVTVYVFNPVTQGFDEWEAAPFWQKNPQETRADGAFQYFLPPGRYYVAAEAAGRRSVTTEIFTLTESQPLLMTLSLPARPRVALGRWSLPLPVWWPLTVPAELAQVTAPVTAEAAGQLAPDGALMGSAGATTLSLVQDRRPAVVTFLLAWSPYLGEQMTALGALAEQSDRVVIPVLVESTAAEAILLKERGGYGFDIWADPEGDLAALFAVEITPTHVVLDAQGRIERVVTGLTTRF